MKVVENNSEDDYFVKKIKKVCIITLLFVLI